MIWTVQTKSILVVVRAVEQLEAFDALRGFDIADFGLIVVAKKEHSDDGDEIAVRTSRLMARWGRMNDARIAIQAAIREGLPDTSKEDGVQ